MDRGEDTRIGSLFGGSSQEPVAVILGFPSDAGVAINGGRPGAAGGPAAIRQQLYRLTPDGRNPERFSHVCTRIVDRGDIEITGDVSRDQIALGDAVAPLLKCGVIPIILGGGHETSFGHFLAYANVELRASILNWDAHLDVRPLVDGQAHSGSSFRLAITHPAKLCEKYTAAGLLPHSVADSHRRFVERSGGACIWRSELSENRIRSLYDQSFSRLMVSFDIDALDQSVAPGVSAPATGGMDLNCWMSAAYEAGACPRVKSVDIVELNPRFDRDGMTARAAALTVWHFFRGLAERM